MIEKIKSLENQLKSDEKDIDKDEKQRINLPTTSYVEKLSSDRENESKVNIHH